MTCRAWATVYLFLLAMGVGQPVMASDDPQVLATVEDEHITLEAFAEKHSVLVSWFGLGVKVSEVEKVLEEMVFEQLLAREARQSQLMAQPSVRAQIDRLLSAAYLESRMSKAKENLHVSKADVQAYYADNRENYRLPQRLRVSHILVRSEAEAQRLQAVWQAGQSFGELAAAHSIDPATSSNGGTLGWVTPEHLLPRLAEVAQAMEPRQARIVQTAFGHHLMLLHEKPAPEYQSFDDLKRKLYHEVLKRKQLDRRNEVKLELWQRYRVDIHHDRLQNLVETSTAEVKRNPKVTFNRPMQPAELAAAPQLQMVSTAYGLGSIAAQPITHTSLVANSGKEELIIREIQTTCRCVTASITPSKLAPGEVGMLTYTYDPNMLEEVGQTSKTIYIKSNDPIHSLRKLQFTATITKEGRSRERL